MARRIGKQRTQYQGRREFPASLYLYISSTSRHLQICGSEIKAHLNCFEASGTIIKRVHRLKTTAALGTGSTITSGSVQPAILVALKGGE